MAIKEKEVWVNLTFRNISNYKDKGYDVSRFNQKESTKILVKVEDLTVGSGVKLTKICDDCGEEIGNKQPYVQILSNRKRNKDSNDKCKKCSVLIMGGQNGVADESNCVATTHPEFAKLFWNVKDTKKFKFNSNKKTDFKCLQCGRKVENRIIGNIFRQGVTCPCNDGFSYSEKFMLSFLEQLNIKFEFQKIFDWSKNVKHDNPKLNATKKYDFFLNELNIIIETHGSQHSEKSFGQKNARTIQEEQENDELKESLAIENGIRKYFQIDCRKSEMEFIKSNILKSQLSELFDLSKIDWLKCHEFAFKSLVYKVCDLWNEGNPLKSISKLFNIAKSTCTKYLKQGSELKLCDYNTKESRKRGFSESSKKMKKSIIQLDLEGKFVKEWESSADVEKDLKIFKTSISKVCRKVQDTAGGFIWMFKEDYSPTKALEIAKNITNDNKKSVIQCSLNGEFIREWESTIEVKRKIGISDSSISLACKGKLKTAGGFQWVYKEEYNKDKIKPVEDTYKRIIQLTKDGKFIKEWKTAREIKRVLGINDGNICSVCNKITKTAGGYQWIFKEEYNKGDIKPVKLKSKKPIIQLSLEGNFISEWDSASEADKVLGISFGSISNTLRGKSKTAGGYKWIYKEDYEKLMTISLKAN